MCKCILVLIQMWEKSVKIVHDICENRMSVAVHARSGDYLYHNEADAN